MPVCSFSLLTSYRRLCLVSQVKQGTFCPFHSQRQTPSRSRYFREWHSSLTVHPTSTPCFSEEVPPFHSVTLKSEISTSAPQVWGCLSICLYLRFDNEDVIFHQSAFPSQIASISIQTTFLLTSRSCRPVAVLFLDGFRFLSSAPLYHLWVQWFESGLSGFPLLISELFYILSQDPWAEYGKTASIPGQPGKNLIFDTSPISDASRNHQLKQWSSALDFYLQIRRREWFAANSRASISSRPSPTRILPPASASYLKVED